jgi:hypothetical protein
MSDLTAVLAFLQKYWDINRSKFAELGIDMPQVLQEWAREKRDALKEFAAEDSFDELCKLGCNALSLAIALALFRPLQAIESKWQLVTGPRRRREQKIRALEKAAAALEELQGSFADAVIADQRQSLPPEFLEMLRREIINPSNLDGIWPEFASGPHPATTTHALRLYASCLRKFGSIAGDTGISSSDMISKYLITAYVHRATGSFHDAEVSGLIGAVLDGVYDETAHRMWRARNYGRIDADFSFLAELLIGIGVVSSTPCG